MRKKVIAGNWKMYNAPSKAVSFVNQIKDKIDTDKSDVVLCVPYISLQPVMDALKGTRVSVGAQNMHYKDEGAVTGEISGAMLKEMGVPYVIIGHSERRAGFNETDTGVNLKTIKALSLGLKPIVCVGESLKQRKEGITNDLLRRQTTIALYGISNGDAEKIIIAYEPIWAIGTGMAATSADAEEACATIRETVAGIYDRETADAIRILYGGSVTADNAPELFAQPNVDGGLVGGASLKPDFERVVNFDGK
ncbi:MAG: triose-phosphate isomerase [Clostridiales bacterium]|jgi:triosephosphate isomerase|nr:triose-phosphate isomerase [Clostridiales bacterium]